MNSIDFNRAYISVGTSTISSQTTSGSKQINTSSGASFQDLLNHQLQKQEGVVFSKHAQQRVNERQIEVSEQLLEKIDLAVDKAQQKGVREALILSDSAAFIVDVSSRTVITTMGSGEMKNNVFTNIDGTVLI